MGEKVLFKEWLCARYSGDASYFGDLAKDVVEDKGFPDDGSADDFISYIESQGASEEALKVMSDAYALFIKGDN